MPMIAFGRAQLVRHVGEERDLSWLAISMSPFT
jgi:hypothetical protein